VHTPKLISPQLVSRRRWLGGAASLAALAATDLAGCATPPPQNRFPELTYAHLGKIRLDVSQINIVSVYKSPFAPPNIEQDMPVLPEKAMRRWAADRLVATGTPGHAAEFVITDAKVIDTKLAKTPGLRGVFTTDQSDRYDSSFAAQIVIRPGPGEFGNAQATASATRAQTVAEGITVNQREKVWFDLVEATMNDLNAELERQIQAHLGPYLR
jgi:hypothetical protein